MSSDWVEIFTEPLKRLKSLSENSVDVIFIDSLTNDSVRDSAPSPAISAITSHHKQLLSECVRALKIGGLLLEYNLPFPLAVSGEYLSSAKFGDSMLLFKYWIAVEIPKFPRDETLFPVHQGMLMYVKTRTDLKNAPAFTLNTSDVRLPHAHCVACGENLKDWGGKKHLMNPRGASLSDVWRATPNEAVGAEPVPSFVIERLKGLTRTPTSRCLHVRSTKPSVVIATTASRSIAKKAAKRKEIAGAECNRVVQEDCIEFLDRMHKNYPSGVFDLAFADPPYNLKKQYDSYSDSLADQQYIDWCNRWLLGMAKTLKPGGSLFVLNLPKWGVHHAAFLHRHLQFRHWIAWDALSDPRGKLMPAHYSLLYYTKPGAPPVFNYSIDENRSNGSVGPPDAPVYCLRGNCVAARKRTGENRKVQLSDIWFDIHRIKHKRDRDAHPCQLPDKLMDRIIRLTTNPGDIVFDPFCGAGTTAVAAARSGRRFVVTEIDPNYVRITEEKLAALRQQTDLFGNFLVPKKSQSRAKPAASKKEVETYLQKFATRLGREPTELEIESDDPEILAKIDLLYPSRRAAIKRCRIVLSRVFST